MGWGFCIKSFIFGVISRIHLCCLSSTRKKSFVAPLVEVPSPHSSRVFDILPRLEQFFSSFQVNVIQW